MSLEGSETLWCCPAKGILQKAKGKKVKCELGLILGAGLKSVCVLHVPVNRPQALDVSPETFTGCPEALSRENKASAGVRADT